MFLRDPLDALGGSNGIGHRVTAPTVERHGDDFTLAWPEHAAVLTLTDVHKNREGIKAELAVDLAGSEIHWGQLNLVATAPREQLVKKLAEIDGAVPWRGLLERTCRIVVAATRQGAAIVELLGEAPLATPDLVSPFVLDGQTCTIFADGDSGKSMLAATIAIASVTGRTLPGGIKAHRPAPVMVCDWETERGAWDGRVRGLCGGLGFEMPTGIYYRPMTAALTDDLTTLAAEAAKLHVGLVIIDSLAPACGPEPEGTGSEPGLTMALTDRKNNTGPRNHPVGLRFAFGPDTITPYPVDLGSRPQLAPSTSLAWRIRVTLAAGRMTAAAIADALSADESTVSRTLRRLRTERKIRGFEDGTWGLLIADNVPAVSGQTIRSSPKAGVS